MPAKLHKVNLPGSEREYLRELVRKGEAKARKLTRARILLKADEGWTDEAVMAALDVSRPTVERIRRRYAQGGLDKALNEDPRPGGRPKLDGKQEAFLVALACSEPPEGRDCWTMQLVADRVVSLGVVESISDETVRLRLKKTSSSPGRSSDGAFPQ